MTSTDRLCATLLGIVLIVAGFQPCSPVHAQDWTEHEVTVAIIAVNEASFREADASAIAEARGRYSVDELRRMHPRATNPNRTDSRRWISDLSADAHQPNGWPSHLVSWDQIGRGMWLRTLRVVRETIAGRRSVCSERPSVWGSPRLDRARLDRILARGGRVVCRGTANSFIVFGGR